MISSKMQPDIYRWIEFARFLTPFSSLGLER
jgi:hypothetical protein